MEQKFRDVERKEKRAGGTCSRSTERTPIFPQKKKKEGTLRRGPGEMKETLKQNRPQGGREERKKGWNIQNRQDQETGRGLVSTEGGKKKGDRN